MAENAVTTQVYQVYSKAGPAPIWDAIGWPYVFSYLKTLLETGKAPAG